MRLIITMLVLVFSSQVTAAPARIEVKGEHEFKLSQSNDRWEISAADKSELNKASVVKSADAMLLNDKTGARLGSCRNQGNKTITQMSASGSVIYLFNLSAQDTYVVEDKDKKKLWRVKIKDDKFNIYGANDKRLRHGKSKTGDVSVRSENDQQLLKIQGVSELRRASYLALPIDAKWQILAFLCAQ